MAVIQGTTLYVAELAWNGEVRVEGECRRAINTMGRPTLGAFRSTPLGNVLAESGLTPARALLDHHQAKFTRRFFARPKGGQGPRRSSPEKDRPSLRASGWQPPSPRRDGRDTGVGKPAVLRFSGLIIVEEGGCPLGRTRVEASGHHLDRRLTL